MHSIYYAVIVGAGYSGLATALGLARNGLSVLLLEDKTVGHGASSRNGGMVGPSFHELGTVGLTRKYGAEKAADILRTGIDALDYAQDLFSHHEIDCDFQMTGRFRGARTESHLKSMIAECQRLRDAVGLQFEPLGASDIQAHTGARCYVGGVIYPRDGGLHPKKLANALAMKAEAEGVLIKDRTPVTAIGREGGFFEISTPRGPVKARQLVLATNGYSDRRVRALNARIVPIQVTVSATRPLGEDRVRAMSPHFHMHGETGRLFIWSRPSPDRTRFIFGGRVSNPRAPAAIQRQSFAIAAQRLYPDLTPDDFEYVWSGKIAYTMDHAPHLDQVDGIWLIGGYCGSGVTRSLYFADKLVRRMTGQQGAETPFDEIKFPRVPFRSFAPLGARMLTKYYGFRDRFDTR